MRNSTHTNTLPMSSTPGLTTTADAPSPGFGVHRSAKRRWLAAGVLALALAAFSLYAVTRVARQDALQEVAAQAHGVEQLKAALLRNQLDKFRALPFVLTSDMDVRAALRAGAQDKAIVLNEKLHTLSRGVGASVIYVLDKTGYAIAASNWREPDSFVGTSYRFRPYYQDAVARGSAELFALGTVSHEAGMYLSQRVNDATGALLGVVVLKVGLNHLEADWRQSGATTFVTERHGVMLLGSLPEWRFDVLAPLSPALAERLRDSQQFGQARFEPLPLTPALRPDSTGQLVRTTRALPQIPSGTALLHTTLPLPGSPGWTLHLLSPVQPAIDRATANAQLATLLALGLLAVGAGTLYYRWHRRQVVATQQALAREELETQVRQRTTDLRQLNAQLRTEMDERMRAEGRLHTMQDELVQASKLALLGQVAAGVAHEVNQPVAAIRSYADNAAQFLQQEQTGQAQENLRIIADLTERIGHITGELRAFSRKAGSMLGPVSLHDAIDGALLLVAPRMHRQEVSMRHAAPCPDIELHANRVKLEQALVNVLQNALDALEDMPEGEILIAVGQRADAVAITLSDNGPGLSSPAQLFTPFHTTRREGLGLGLVISRDILRECGGELSAGTPDATFPAPPVLSGAVFTLVLPKASQSASASPTFTSS